MVGRIDLKGLCACARADSKMTLGIHREAPPFADQSTAQEILVTGIKVPHLPSFYQAWGHALPPLGLCHAHERLCHATCCMPVWCK